MLVTIHWSGGEVTDYPEIDFIRYPLDKGIDAVADTITACQKQLDRKQYCSLPGFFPADTLAKILTEVDNLMPHANQADSLRNCYLQRYPDPLFPDDHPRNIMNRARYRMIPADLFAAESPLKKLYFWNPFRTLIARIVGESVLYPSEDPLQPVNVICYGSGDQSAWHYDSDNAFTMTLMLQSAERGGLFELVPNTRCGDQEENLEYVSEILGGDQGRVHAVSRMPGELTIFRGCNSLHRVTPVVGERRRLMAVFVYEKSPGLIGDPVVNQTVYGRIN